MISSERSASVIQFEKHTSSTGDVHIDTLFSAIKAKLSLRVEYQSFNADKANEFIFHSYLLKEYRNRWFVIGRKDSSKSITNLALDRIKKIRNSNNTYLKNDLFDPEVYFNKIIGVTIPVDAEVEVIEIRVAAKQAPYIRTKPVHYSQKIVHQYANGDIKIHLWLIDIYELRAVLMSYGCDIEILKPLDLRHHIQRNLFICLKQYKELQ